MERQGRGTLERDRDETVYKARWNRQVVERRQTGGGAERQT